MSNKVDETKKKSVLMCNGKLVLYLPWVLKLFLSTVGRKMVSFLNRGDVRDMASDAMTRPDEGRLLSIAPARTDRMQVRLVGPSAAIAT